jgi:HEAT repeat-containing protein 5
MRLIQHPHIAVQAAVCWGLRSFVLAAPSQIAPILLAFKSDLQKHLDLLSDANQPHGRIALGVAQGLAVVVQVCSFRLLYFSADTIVEIWTLANSLLQTSANSDLRSSQVQIQVSWSLIGALMATGAQFIKSRLNQLLLLWQNALPRPFSKDSMAGRTIGELQYLLHVRERALAALWLFLLYNAKSLTNETSKRIMNMLVDTNIFLGRLPSPPINDDVRGIAAYSQLAEIATKVKMRVIKCYCCLVGPDVRNVAGPELLMTAISVFSESDPPISKFAIGKQTMIGSFESLNLTTDNYAWGVSSLIRSLSIPDDKEEQGRHWSDWDSDSEILERMVLSWS